MKEKLFAARRSQIVIEEFEQEILIYDLKTNKVYCLNETSAFVYQLCDGKNSVAEISRRMRRKFKHEISEDLIWLAIEQFKTNDLLAESATLDTKFAGLSRREAVKKIGFTSMVALPVVSFLVAPTATQAASTCQPCTASLPIGQLCFIPQGCPASNVLGYNTTGCGPTCRFCECTIPGGAQSCSTVCSVSSRY